MLILAAVSIATLTGENGILTQARNARDKTNKANVVEQAQTDILGYQAENKSGEVTAKQLKDVLSKYFNDVPEEDELTNKLKEEDFKLKSKAEYGGQDIEIADIYAGGLTEEKKEEIFNAEELTIGVETAQNTEKYGWKVKNYNVQYNCGTDLSKTSDVWRLFYQDEKYTYLITDELVGSYKPSDYYDKEGDQEKYKDGTKMSTVGKKLNAKVSSLFTDESKKANSNIRATVWFTDTENEEWKKYKNGDAEFCIASPTAELFEASYNKNTNSTHQSYKNNQIELTLEDYGYSENTEKNWLKAADSHGIYNKDDSSYWWLASPGYSSSYNCLYVSGSDRLFQLRRREHLHVCGSPNSLYSNV